MTDMSPVWSGLIAGGAGHKIYTDTAVTIHQYRKCAELICNYTNNHQRLPELINPITVTEVTMGLVMVM